MKFWTILALLVAICAVFLGVGHTEETGEDFIQPEYFEDAVNDEELPDSFESKENNDNEADDDNDDPNALDETGNTLDSVNDTPWNDEDESKMFKRSPWLVRRRGRRRIGKLIDRVCKYGRFVPGVGFKCRVWRIIRRGDEEFPRQKIEKKASQNDEE